MFTNGSISYSDYLALQQINELKIIYHPIYKYFIRNDDFFNQNQDKKISKVLGLDKEKYQEMMIETFNGKKKYVNVYFNQYKEAQLAMEWVNSMILIRKLRGI